MSVGFTQPPMAERDRVLRRYVRSNGELPVCDYWHEVTGFNIYPFEGRTYCKKCVESGVVEPVTTRVVYFITDGLGHVKIGYADNVEARLSGLQTANPHDLTVLATQPGSGAVERDLHARFKAHHVRGEWFRLAPEIVEYISEIPPPAKQVEPNCVVTGRDARERRITIDRLKRARRELKRKGLSP